MEGKSQGFAPQGYQQSLYAVNVQLTNTPILVSVAKNSSYSEKLKFYQN